MNKRCWNCVNCRAVLESTHAAATLLIADENVDVFISQVKIPWVAPWRRGLLHFLPKTREIDCCILCRPFSVSAGLFCRKTSKLDCRLRDGTSFESKVLLDFELWCTTTHYLLDLFNFSALNCELASRDIAILRDIICEIMFAYCVITLSCVDV